MMPSVDATSFWSRLCACSMAHQQVDRHGGNGNIERHKGVKCPLARVRVFLAVALLAIPLLSAQAAHTEA